MSESSLSLSNLGSSCRVGSMQPGHGRAAARAIFPRIGHEPGILVDLRASPSMRRLLSRILPLACKLKLRWMGRDYTNCFAQSAIKVTLSNQDLVQRQRSV